MDTEQRLSAVEAKLAEYEQLIARLMFLAAKHPLGRKFLKSMENQR